MTTDYDIKPSDITYVANLLNMLKDDGVWAVPRTGGIFTFNKVNKTFRFTPLCNNPLPNGTDEITIAILTQHLGYTDATQTEVSSTS